MKELFYEQLEDIMSRVNKLEEKVNNQLIKDE